MVDEIRELRRDGPAGPGAKGDMPADDEAQIQKARDGAQAQAVTQDDDLFQQVNHRVQKLRETPPSMWTRPMLRKLAETIGKLIELRKSLARKIDSKNSYAIDQAANAVRQQVRQLVNSLNPPPEIAESADFQHIIEQLWPKSMQRQGSEYERGSGMRGTIKEAVQIKLVRDAIEKATKQVARRGIGEQMSAQPHLAQFARLGLEQMSRQIRRKLKALKRGKVVNEDGELEEMSDEERRERRREIQELMELFSQAALDTMKEIRTEVAPKWAPEQQQWLIAHADKQVYDILLATAEEAMLAETQAWDEIQDLRSGQAVFTLRAADKLTEAAARRSGD